AIARTGAGQYALVAELVIARSGRNSPTDPAYETYGEFFAEGDPALSRYFDVSGQENVEEVIRRLSIRPGAELLGQAFQGLNAVRLLTPEDDMQLRSHAEELRLDARLSAGFAGKANGANRPARAQEAPDQLKLIDLVSDKSRLFIKSEF